MTDLVLSDEEIAVVRKFARLNHISEFEAAQRIFREGIQRKLTEFTPTTMTIQRIKRDSK